MLLLLFGGGTIDPAIPIGEAVITPPVVSHGYVIERPATSGTWRFVLELGDPAAGAEFTWFDITEFYAGDAYQRGADDYLGVYRAAVAQVQLQTDNDDLAPWGQDTSDLFGVDVPLDAGLLMRLGMIRVVAGVAVEWEPLWTGRVETWGDASAARGQIRTHVVTVTDTIGDLANVPTIITSNDIDYDEWLTENLTGAQWLFGVDFYGDIAGNALLQDLTPKAAIARMDDGTTPFGLVWRSRRTGRLIVYPAPWDTTNVDRWPNPLLDSYPSGLVFSFSPDFTEIEYIDDDEQQPFGIQRTSLGVINSIVANFEGDFGPEVYAVDDPVSIGRYGVRPLTVSIVASFNPQTIDDILAARAYSSSQALPLRTTLDHQGFWSALAIIDQFDPVTVVHAARDASPVVTATGTVRNVTENRTVRHESGLTWQSTVQIDLASTETTPALLPVEDLAWIFSDSPSTAGPSYGVFEWTNPTQPDVTPTEVQLRVLGNTLIWTPTDYPGVGVDGATINWLQPGTWYTLQVRLVRRSGGVVTHVSPIREVRFPTPNRIFPIPIPDGTDTDVLIPEPPGFDDEDCELELELQENDGTGWTTIESYDESDMVDNGDGTWSLRYPIPNSTFDADKIYRLRSREICGTVVGDWFTGSSFDPPEDWTDPCIQPPAVVDPPYDDGDMIVYVPAVCRGDDIVEYVSDITGVHGPAFLGFYQFPAEPDRIALLSIPQPGWDDAPGGILAYGECPQINGEYGSKSILALVNVGDPENCTLFEVAGMRLTCTASGGQWSAGATLFTEDGTLFLSSGLLDVDTSYNIAATYDAGTGDAELFVNATSVDTGSIGGASATIHTLPIWQVGAPPETWITDCGLWSRVLSSSELPGYSPIDPIAILGSKLVAWWDGDNPTNGTPPADGTGILTWEDRTTNAHDVGRRGGSGTDATYKTPILGGHGVMRFDGSDDGYVNNSAFIYAMGSCQIWFVARSDESGSGVIIAEGRVDEDNTAYRIVDIDSTNEYQFNLDNNTVTRFVNNQSRSVNDFDLVIVNDYGGSTGTSVEVVDVDSGTTGAYTRDAMSLFQLAIGFIRRSSDALFFDGDIADILVLSSPADSGERSALAAYFNDKWGKSWTPA